MKHTASYELPFAGLKPGKHQFDWDASETLLTERGADRFTSCHFSIHLDLDKSERLITLEFSIKGEVNTDCDRCGEDLQAPFSVKSKLYLKLAHETDLSDDEVIFVNENADSIDLESIIYELIMVNMPGRFIHNIGGCNPEVENFLTAQADNNENENEADPRWEALKKLKS